MWRYCKRIEQRVEWKLWKEWHGLLPFRNTDDLTDDQVAWCYMQAQIDDGLEFCEACDSFGFHAFCGNCGRRYGARMRECVDCHVQCSSDYCVLCGRLLASDFVKRYERGEANWTPLIQKATEAVTNLLTARPSWKAILYPELGVAAPASVPDAIMEAFRRG